MDLLEGTQQLFQAVGEHDGGGGVGEHEGAGDEEGDAQHHEEGGPQPLHRDFQELPLPDGVAGGVEDVEHGGEDDDEEDGFHAPEDGLGPDLGDGDAGAQGQEEDGVGRSALGGEEGHDVEDGKEQLGPGGQPVDDGIAGEILPQGDVLEGHYTAPFRAR